MDREILRADKPYRHRVLLIFLVISLLGFLAIKWGLPLGITYLKGLDTQKALTMIKYILMSFMLSAVPVGLFLLKLGYKIMKAEIFPLPGMKVTRDTKITKGKRAKIIGQTLMGFGVLIILMSLIGAIQVNKLIQSLKKP